MCNSCTGIHPFSAPMAVVTTIMTYPAMGRPSATCTAVLLVHTIHIEMVGFTRPRRRRSLSGRLLLIIIDSRADCRI